MEFIRLFLMTSEVAYGPVPPSKDIMTALKPLTKPAKWIGEIAGEYNGCM